MADTTTPVLELSTLVERPTIAIDGTRYDILSADELSVVALERFTRMGRRIDELGRLDAPTPEQQSDLAEAIGEVAASIMVGVPDDVRDRLSLVNLMRVIEVFIGLLPARMKRQAGAATSSTGARPRPGSSASTAGIPAGGSAKRRSRSSGHT